MKTISTHAGCRVSTTIRPVQPTGRAIATDAGCRRGITDITIPGMIPGTILGIMAATIMAITAIMAAITAGRIPGVMAGIAATTVPGVTMDGAHLIIMVAHTTGHTAHQDCPEV